MTTPFSDAIIMLNHKIINVNVFGGNFINYHFAPSDLRITDMRFVDIDGAPKGCTFPRIDTNQGISGFGEVRDVIGYDVPLAIDRFGLVCV